MSDLGVPTPRCGFCKESLPRLTYHGQPMKFCSPAHRLAAWNLAHPRLTLLPSKPSRCDMILGRLQAGAATGLDLLRAGGGLRYGARIAELRERGHLIFGPKPWRRPDGTLEELITTPLADGHERYELRIPCRP